MFNQVAAPAFITIDPSAYSVDINSGYGRDVRWFTSLSEAREFAANHMLRFLGDCQAGHDAKAAIMAGANEFRI